jgi:drug/metabolite transporter (DMT)-like permease
VLVAVLGVVTLDEHLSRKQWLGIGTYLVGVLVYLLPARFEYGDLIGLGIATVCVFAIAGSTIVGRYVNRDEEIPSTTVTVISMAVGAALLMTTGTARHGLVSFSQEGAIIAVVLAVFNTAAAYTLWNHALRTLTAAEAGIVLSTITIQVAILEWVFLNIVIIPREALGLTVGVLGVLLVHSQKEGGGH